MKSLMFTDEMVRAIEAGKKIHTRRTRRPAFKVGEVIYVRESLYICDTYEIEFGVNGQPKWPSNPVDPELIYRGSTTPGIEWNNTVTRMNKMFMPEWASRLKLRITGIHQQPLGEMTDRDARLEGVDSMGEFRKLWKSINGDWTPEQVVYVIEFEIHRQS